MIVECEAPVHGGRGRRKKNREKERVGEKKKGRMETVEEYERERRIGRRKREERRQWKRNKKGERYWKRENGGQETVDDEK